MRPLCGKFDYIRDVSSVVHSDLNAPNPRHKGFSCKWSLSYPLYLLKRPCPAAPH